jgi:hypothetical protein
MRALIKIIICAVALTGCSDKADTGNPVGLERVRPENIELKQGVVYLKSSGEPLTGIVEELWPNGKKKKTTGYKSGKLHGEVLEWYLSGQKKSQGQWEDGVREGARFIYSEDGLEQYEEAYRKGVLVSQKGSASEKLKAQIRKAAFSREKMDQEVWKDEITAQEYESSIVRLWDDLRAAKHDWQPLRDFIFNSLKIGGPEKTSHHQHAVQKIVFGKPNKTMDRAQWKARLLKWHVNGYRLVETEWHQEVFEPAEAGKAAYSEFKVTAHLRHNKDQERFVVRGRLHIRWSGKRGLSGKPIASDMWLTEMVMMKRTGRIPFVRSAVLDVLREDPQKRSRLQDLAKAGSPGNALVAPLLVEDLTGDGLPEVVLAGANRLYINHGGMNFESKKLMPELTRELMAACLADLNNDGKLDLFAVANGAVPAVFLGKGDGSFQFPPKTVKMAPVDFPQCVSVGDCDGDGDLDVYLGQYKPPYGAGQMPTPYYDANDGAPAFLFINDGKGNLVDGTAAAGLDKKNRRRTFSGSLVDLDADRDLDLVVVSDFAGIDIYLNDGAGKFSDNTDHLGSHRYSFGMSHALADFNGDGRVDIYMTGMGSTTARRLTRLGKGRKGFGHLKAAPEMGYGNRLLLGQGRGRFKQPDYNDMLARTGWSWGCTPWDFDGDGDRDLYIANGNLSAKSAQDYCTTFWRHDLRDGKSNDSFVMTGVYKQCMAGLGKDISWNGYEHNALLVNEGAEGYSNISFLLGLSFEFDSRSVVSADLDLDGKPDLMVVERDRLRNVHQTFGFANYVHLVRNQISNKNHWIGVHLPLDKPDYQPFGATVWVHTETGKQGLPVVTGDSYKSQHPTTRHFGLGEIDQVKAIVVQWLNGKVTRLENPGVDCYHMIKP